MDVKLVNVDVSGDEYVGALAGSSPSEVSDIIGCSVTGGSVTASGSKLGGLLGYNDGFVQNCYSTVLVSGSATDAGGLIGENYNGTVTGCYTAGTLSGSNTYTGGLVGYAGSNSTVTQSYSEMAVTGYAKTGSLIGQNRGTVSDCYALGDASASFTGSGCETGALVGFNYGSIQNCFSTGSVTDCLSGAAIAGCSYEGDIAGCFWDIQTSGEDKAYTIAFDYTPVYSSQGVAGSKTTAQMQSKSTFTDEGWDFSSDDGDEQVWIMLPGSYPKLAVFGYEIEGDIDGSGEVNLEDLSMMAAEWLLAGDYAADINDDGKVDMEDYAALAEYWQG
ncbi:GLUG domain protein [Sedimentisphaera cyanobacteriorum]|uniref:GLUG domain protein n=1 Tax=Sedimentisphaera cyanobacteriorum TaxID=1940790 RepID=A0A1Q2HS44_9BACT|nr:dockerin type I repeat-containing protein [Sedimentisphaera cyanobacteriorum]AQQ10252.1 GLUG domain protein [Sedimentisphaera cyanobacteriorum]